MSYFGDYSDNLPPHVTLADAWERVEHRFTVNQESGCWEWPGARNQYGYGQIKFHGRGLLVHRIAYERFKGSIKDGLEIDHLCRNRCCLNPEHLETVTRRENTLRGVAPAALIHKSGCCAKGHPRTPEHGGYVPGRKPGNQTWHCRTCENERQNKRYHKNKHDELYRERKRASDRAYRKRLLAAKEQTA